MGGAAVWGQGAQPVPLFTMQHRERRAAWIRPPCGNVLGTGLKERRAGQQHEKSLIRGTRGAFRSKQKNEHSE